MVRQFTQPFLDPGERERERGRSHTDTQTEKTSHAHIMYESEGVDLPWVGMYTPTHTIMQCAESDLVISLQYWAI